MDTSSQMRTDTGVRTDPVRGTAKNVGASVSVAEARVAIDKSISEKEFQTQVIELARVLGYICYHTYNSENSEPGFPDLTMVRERVVFAELKSAKGRVTPDQQKWHDRLREKYTWTVGASPRNTLTRCSTGSKC